MKNLYLFLICLFLSLYVIGQDDYPNIDTSHPKFRLALGSGVGFMTASTKDAKEQIVNYGFSESEAKSYYNRLKFSIPADVHLHYLINKNVGIGFHYNFFGTESQLSGVLDVQDGIHFANWNIEEHMYLNFIGLSGIIQEFYGIDKRVAITGAYSLGYLSYRDEVYTMSFPYLITGNTIAMTGDLGIEYLILPNLAFGADLSYLAGVIRKMNIDNGFSSSEEELEKEDYENISRISLSAGLKFYF